MNEERPEASEDRDARVSAAYRDLAREQPGATLDEVILREARLSAGRGLPRSLRWFRPLAWAATVGLCLAIVIEISLLPDDAGVEPAEEFAGPAAVPGTDAAIPEPAPHASDAPASVTPERTDGARRKSQSPAAAREETESPASADASNVTVSDEAKALGAASSVELQDLRLLREAEERARLQSGSATEPANSGFAPAAAEAVDAEHYCDEGDTVDPNTWLECIRRLERDGLHDAARIERDRLQRAFPGPELVTPRP